MSAMLKMRNAAVTAAIMRRGSLMNFARRSIPGEVRPEFIEMEAYVKDKQ